jgi:hypothetical protein
VTTPDDPQSSTGDDWGFPDVEPSVEVAPTDVALPTPAGDDPPVYDTGSDAWWRAQAAAAAAAAEADKQARTGPAASPPTAPPPPAQTPPPPPAHPPAAAAAVPAPGWETPPALVEPQVLTPLDKGWMPDGVAPVRPSPEPPAAIEPGPEEPVATRAHEHPVATDPSDAGQVPPPASQPAPDPTPAPGPGPAPEPAPVPPAPRPERPTPPPVTSYEDAARERLAPPAPPVSRGRAAAGALVALLGVGLGVGGLLLVNDGTEGDPTVVPPVVTASAVRATPSPSSAPTTAPSTVPTTAPSTVPTTAPTQAAPAPRLPVSVLNNSKISGLAARAAARFRAAGWSTATEGNYRGSNLPTTTIYYPPGQQATAERFAKEFGIPRVAPRFAGLPTQGLTVVLTRDYA